MLALFMHRGVILLSVCVTNSSPPVAYVRPPEPLPSGVGLCDPYPAAPRPPQVILAPAVELLSAAASARGVSRLIGKSGSRKLGSPATEASHRTEVSLRALLRLRRTSGPRSSRR